MDAAFHLHPSLLPDGSFTTKLPVMPAGTYRLYGDVVHASGFPRDASCHGRHTRTACQAQRLTLKDASAFPAPLTFGELGATYVLPDHYTLVWDHPGVLAAATPYTFHFRLLDPAGHPATGMQPYLGMAGHAAFVKTDGTVFAHTHPDGSAAMPDVMLAEASLPGAAEMSMHPMEHAAPTTAEVSFPYGFPTPGRYRIFIQMKHNDTVENRSLRRRSEVS